jgi:hypothetical protein
VIRWLHRFWPKNQHPTSIGAPGTSSISAVQIPPQRLAESEQPVLPWLLGNGALVDAPLSLHERAALNALDEILLLPNIPDSLLPRAAALIPQLISLMRQTELPTAAVAQRIGKDALLAVEVMRLARSSYYGVQSEVSDLQQAITLIGLQGLQTVIVRVVLKPIYAASKGLLSGSAAPRLWEHSEALARHTAILAQPIGQKVLDGYIAGMLHDTGWTVALGIMDNAGITLDQPSSTSFAAALDDKTHRLFGLAAQRWKITPSFTALAEDARRNGNLGGTHPLLPALRQAQRECMEELSPTPVS